MIYSSKYSDLGNSGVVYNVHIVNRYYPPNPAVTGEEASKMAAYLLNCLTEVAVTVNYINAPYMGGGSNKKPVGNLSALQPIYKGRSKLLRFLGNFLEGRKLIKTALTKADIIISLTDPPLLNYWSGNLCKKKGVPWIYWSLDLYPDAFASAGLVSKNNPFYRYFAASFRKNTPDLFVALGKEQARFIQKTFYRDIPSIILPCGIHNEPANETRPEWRRDEGKIYFAYAGNLGEAHSHDFLIDFVRCLDPNKHRCILALYGSGASSVLREVKDNPTVEIVTAISRKDLYFVDVHLVSLKPDWTHICVPSKAVSAVCAGGTILFNGSEGADTWQMFHDAGWLVQECENRETRMGEIRALLKEISVLHKLSKKKEHAIRLKRELFDLESYAHKSIAEWIIKTAVEGNTHYREDLP